MAQARSTAVGSSAEAQSTAQTGFYATVVQSMATAPTGGTATTNAIAQAGGAGQAFANPGQTAYAFTSRRSRQGLYDDADRNFERSCRRVVRDRAI